MPHRSENQISRNFLQCLWSPFHWQWGFPISKLRQNGKSSSNHPGSLQKIWSTNARWIQRNKLKNWSNVFPLLPERSNWEHRKQDPFRRPPTEQWQESHSHHSEIQILRSPHHDQIKWRQWNPNLNKQSKSSNGSTQTCLCLQQCSQESEILGLCSWSLEHSTLGVWILEFDRAKSKMSELISPQSDKDDPWPKMRKSRKKKSWTRRWWFNNIPNIETYIIRRTSRYIGKVIRSEKNNIPQKLLSAWIFAPRKIGRLQNSCNNNFLIAISALIPEVKKNGKFQSWTPLTGEESSWNNKINIFFAASQNPNSNDKATMQNLQFYNYELVNHLLTHLPLTYWLTYLLTYVPIHTHVYYGNLMGRRSAEAYIIRKVCTLAFRISRLQWSYFVHIIAWCFSLGNYSPSKWYSCILFYHSYVMRGSRMRAMSGWTPSHPFSAADSNVCHHSPIKENLRVRLQVQHEHNFQTSKCGCNPFWGNVTSPARQKQVGWKLIQWKTVLALYFMHLAGCMLNT